jgi:hypothetical protein
MRKYFYLGVIFFVLIALVAAGVYLFGRALYTVYADWRLGKELDELQAEVRERRQRRDAEGGRDASS